MPRIRTIKPEYWSSPGIENISPWSRLLFIAMWNWADDAGRGTCQLKELQAFAFPYDEDDTAPEVATMAGFRRTLAQVREQYGVVFYKVDGRPYYAIPSWRKHQRNERTAQSKYPAPDEGKEWDFLPPDQRSGGTSDTFRPTVAEAENGPAEEGANPTEAPEDEEDVYSDASGVIPLFGTPNTPPELGSGGTSDIVRHGAAEAPQSSGPGTGEQGNRGTGEQNSSAKGGADAPSANLDVFGNPIEQPDPDAPKAKKPDHPLFVEFWEPYPKKTKKDRARTAWKRAVKNGADPQDLIAGSKLYGQMWEGATKEELDYAHNPVVWLTDEMWDGSWHMRDMSRANGGRHLKAVSGDSYQPHSTDTSDFEGDF